MLVRWLRTTLESISDSRSRLPMYPSILESWQGPFDSIVQVKSVNDVAVRIWRRRRLKSNNWAVEPASKDLLSLTLTCNSTKIKKIQEDPNVPN